jgi:tetratricopeptide (TPR) repeat protein
VTLAGQLADADEVAELYNQAGAELERAGINHEAAAAFRAALDRRPLDANAYARARALLLSLYAEQRDPGPLVELYGHRLEHLDPGEKRERLPLLFDRAELLAKEGDLAGAERDLRALLESEPDHTEATRRLGEVLAQIPDHRAEAIARLERYLELEPDAARKRSARVRLAVLQETTEPEVAVRHLEAALEVEKTAAELDRLATLLVRLRHWQRAVEMLGRLAALLPSGSHRAKAEVRVAAIYRDGFADPRAAAEALLRALENDPLELEAFRQLVPMAHVGQVDRRVIDQHLRRAIDKVSAEITLDPSVAAPYGTLARLWGWRGDEDARAVAAQALALVSGQKPPVRQPASDPTRELSGAHFERVMGEATQGAALAIWRITAEASARIYGPELGALGATRADRVNVRSVPPAWVAVDQMAHGLGVTPYELYVSSRPDVCAVVAAQLVCGSDFTVPLEPTRRFMVARRLALLRDRLGPLETLDVEELEVHFAACARLAELSHLPSLGRIAANDPRINERAKALGKALGRKERKALAALAARFAELEDLEAFRTAVLKGAARLGLAVGGDLEAALVTLGLDAAGDPLAWELMRFATSELFLTVRREMGLRG